MAPSPMQEVTATQVDLRMRTEERYRTSEEVEAGWGQQGLDLVTASGDGEGRTEHSYEGGGMSRIPKLAWEHGGEKGGRGRLGLKVT